MCRTPRSRATWAVPSSLPSSRTSGRGSSLVQLAIALRWVMLTCPRNALGKEKTVRMTAPRSGEEKSAGRWPLHAGPLARIAKAFGAHKSILADTAEAPAVRVRAFAEIPRKLREITATRQVSGTTHCRIQVARRGCQSGTGMPVNFRTQRVPNDRDCSCSVFCKKPSAAQKSICVNSFDRHPGCSAFGEITKALGMFKIPFHSSN